MCASDMYFLDSYVQRRGILLNFTPPNTHNASYSTARRKSNGASLGESICVHRTSAKTRRRDAKGRKRSRIFSYTRKRNVVNILTFIGAITLARRYPAAR